MIFGSTCHKLSVKSAANLLLMPILVVLQCRTGLLFFPVTGKTLFSSQDIPACSVFSIWCISQNSWNIFGLSFDGSDGTKSKGSHKILSGEGFDKMHVCAMLAAVGFSDVV